MIKPQEPPSYSSLSGTLDPQARLPSPASEKSLLDEQNITPPLSLPNKKSENWVQCDNKSCRKWRRLPDYVDVSTLPTKYL